VARERAAAINLLGRAADADIGLYTLDWRVKQIIQELADRQRSRLPDPTPQSLPVWRAKHPIPINTDQGIGSRLSSSVGWRCRTACTREAARSRASGLGRETPEPAVYGRASAQAARGARYVRTPESGRANADGCRDLLVWWRLRECWWLGTVSGLSASTPRRSSGLLDILCLPDSASALVVDNTHLPDFTPMAKRLNSAVRRTAPTFVSWPMNYSPESCGWATSPWRLSGSQSWWSFVG
jgi:hypothetical protein